MHPGTSQQELQPVRLRSTEVASRQALWRLLAVVAGSGLLALCSRIAVPHAWTPVPTTMQTFGVVVLGMVLGPWTALCSVLLYLAEGAAGLPVFAPSLSAGLAILRGSTAGYLLSYPLAAVVAGLVFRALRQRTGRFIAALTAAAIAEVPIFALGALWLGLVIHAAPAQLASLAVLPFLPGEAVKILLAASLLQALGAASRRHGHDAA